MNSSITVRVKLARAYIVFIICIGMIIAADSMVHQGDLSWWKILTGFLLLVPLLVIGYDAMFFKWPYTLIGGKATSVWPHMETPIRSTPLFRDRPNFVATGFLASIMFGLSPFSSYGIKMVLFRSGLGISVLGKKTFIKSSQITNISRVSVIPKIFYVYHESPEARSPIAFSDDSFRLKLIHTIQLIFPI